MPPRKRGPGRPPLGDAGRSQVLTLKVSADERREWERDAGDLKLSEWIRARCNSPVERIVVRADDGDWHWTAYGRHGRPVTCSGIESGPQLEKRVRRAVEEHGGSGVENAIVEIES